jgi:hypothetical protein
MMLGQVLPRYKEQKKEAKSFQNRPLGVDLMFKKA